MRVVKKPDERKGEILDIAEYFFVTKGYAKTTIMDILNGIGIAKGTFYYYFKSKEEVLDAVIARLVERDAKQAKKIVEDATISPVEKLCKVLMEQRPGAEGNKDKILQQMSLPGNAEMRQRSLVLGVRILTPIFAEIIEQGIRQGDFSTGYPKESMEFLMVSGQVLFDQGLFEWDQEQLYGKIKAFIHTMELVLGAEPGSFDFMAAVLSEG